MLADAILRHVVGTAAAKSPLLFLNIAGSQRLLLLFTDKPFRQARHQKPAARRASCKVSHLATPSSPDMTIAPVLAKRLSHFGNVSSRAFEGSDNSRAVAKVSVK